MWRREPVDQSCIGISASAPEGPWCITGFPAQATAWALWLLLVALCLSLPWWAGGGFAQVMPFHDGLPWYLLQPVPFQRSLFESGKLKFHSKSLI